MDPSGLLKIQFKQQMKVPDKRDFIQNDTITLNGTVYPILAFEVVPGRYTDPLKTKFNWTYVDFTPQELVIQLNFEHLNYISATNGYPDMIKVTIYGIQYFADSLGNFMLPATVLNLKTMPPLASKSAVLAAFQ